MVEQRSSCGAHPPARWIFVGSKRLGLRICEAVLSTSRHAFDRIATIDDRNDARSVHADFLALSDRHGVDVEVLAKHSDLVSLIGSGTQAVLVCGYYRLLSEELLGQPEKGIIGIHNSLLPKYRGGAPLVWSMINGDEQVGSSLFRLSGGVDDGPVFHQWRIALSQEAAIGDVLAELEASIGDDIAALWDGIIEGSLRGRPQDEGQATYSAQRKPEDGRIDWSLPASVLHNFIRAQSRPYPGAFFLHNDKRVYVHRSRVFEHPYACTPGQVLGIAEGALTIGCGENSAIVLGELVQDGCPLSIPAHFDSLKTRL